MEGDSVVEPTAPNPSVRSRPLLHFKELSLGVQNKKTRFTCVHASENFLACGANNGSVYLFVTSAARTDNTADTSKRVFPAKYHLVKTIAAPGNNGDRASVSCLSVCPLQKRLVVGTIGGVVYGIQLTDYNKMGEKVEFTHDFHSGFPVTCFVWDRLGMKLYSACNGGMVAMTTLRAGVSAFFGRTDTELLLKEDTGIVQLDTAKYGKADILMVSSQMRVLLLNLSSNDGSAVQIGTKTRQGNFGACFFTSTAVDEVEAAKRTNVKVFSSRPGRRVWVADPQTGTVSATLKFSLGKTPSKFLQDPGCQSEESIQSRDLTINKLALYQFIHDPYAQATSADRSLLVSWNVGSSVLFFIDPIAVEIVEWHVDLGIIHDLKVLDESVVVVLHGEPPKVSVIQSCTARQFLDIYAGEDVRKALEMAIEFQINDAAVLEGLKNQWSKFTETHGQNGSGRDSLTDKFDELYQKAKDLEARSRSPHLESPGAAVATPLQVIFKQRPQPQNSQQPPTPDYRGGPPDLITGSPYSKTSPGKPTEYLDVRTPNLSYRRNIYAPDGSTLEARLVDIKELPQTEPIVEDQARDAWMEDVLDEVRKFEALKAETDGMLPSIRGTLNNTGAAAKAMTTYIPGANMISNLVDTAVNINYTGRGSAVNMFGEFPDADTIFLDPVEMKKPAIEAEAHEYAVLRIAMSSVEGVGSNSVDSEVLMEAISLNIWDSNLKYISNLPLDQQISLPEAPQEEDEIKKNPFSPRRVKQSKRKKRPSEVAATTGSNTVEAVATLQQIDSASELQVDTSSSTAESSGNASSHEPPTTRRHQRLNRRSSLSPVAGRSMQRAVQRLIGGGPSCDFERKCLVSGQLATSPELENILKREVSDLLAELNAAAATAEKTARLTRRLWPAAGITRVCACLTNMYLFEGELVQVQKTIRSWLLCFDPTAKLEEAAARSPSAAKQKEMAKNGAKPPTSLTRGEALIDGDGLPLTRNDWTLVRVMVSLYFAISAAGSALRIRPASPADLVDGGQRVQPYAYEMGIVLHVGTSSERDASIPQWSVKDATEFIKKYGIYLNTELAAEVCNKQQLDTALNAVLDQVVSSSSMARTCDDVVNWIVEKQVAKALECLKDMDSLCLVLHVLDLLLKKCPDEAVKLCVDRYPALSPWNVERCLFGAQQTTSELLKRENAPQTATYYRYIVRLLEERCEISGQDAALVDRCLQLSFGGAKIVGKAFENKHTQHADVNTLVASILKQPRVFKYDAEAAWKLCMKNHVHQGLLELLYESLKAEAVVSEASGQRLATLIQVIVEHKQLSLLDDLLHRTAWLKEETARHVTTEVLSHIAEKQTTDVELTTMTVHSLLRGLGPTQGMEILAQYPLLFASSPLSMYQTIVEASLLTKLQENQVKNMLEAVDSNVWATYKRASTRNSVTFAPQIQAVFDMETRGLRPPVDQAKFDQWIAKQQKYDAELPASTGTEDESMAWPVTSDARLVSRGFEYRSSDWGGEIQLHDATCAVCDLPVVIIGDHNSNLEVALLPCGHAFHASCLRDTACAVCFDTSYVSIDWSTQ